MTTNTGLSKWSYFIKDYGKDFFQSYREPSLSLSLLESKDFFKKPLGKKLEIKNGLTSGAHPEKLFQTANMVWFTVGKLKGEGG